MKALRRHVFPIGSVRLQKRHLRRHLKKPEELTARQWKVRVAELNNCIPRFAPDVDGGGTPTELADDELVESLEVASPKLWQAQMMAQDFDPVGKTLDEMLAFFERMEQCEAQGLF